MNIDQFKDDIALALTIPTTSSPDDCVQLYNDTLRKIADKHAPEQKKTIRIRPQTHWYTDDIKEAKITRRRLERQWKHTGLEVHHQMFLEQRNRVTLMIKNSKRSYYSNLINNSKDQKELYSITINCCTKPSVRSYPSVLMMVI